MVKGPDRNIAKKKDQGDFEAIIHELGNSDWKIRSEAASALGDFCESKVVDALILTLEDSEDVVRRSVIDALSKIKDPRAVEPLTLLLWQGRYDSYITNPVEDTLIKIGPESVDGIIRTIENNPAYRLRIPAIAILGRIGDQRAVDFLCRILKDAGKPKPVDYFDDTPYWQIRETVVTALGEIGDSIATEAIISVLLRESSIDSWKTQYAAAYALDKLGWKPRADEISAFYWVTKLKWDKCLELGSLSFEPLVKLVNDGGNTSIEAAVCLGQIGDSRAIKPLLNLKKKLIYSDNENLDDALRKLGWKG